MDVGPSGPEDAVCKSWSEITCIVASEELTQEAVIAIVCSSSQLLHLLPFVVWKFSVWVFLD